MENYFENQICAIIDLRFQINLNSYNILMAVFVNIGHWPVNSAKLSWSSEVTLTCIDTYTKYKHIGNRKNESKMSADF